MNFFLRSVIQAVTFVCVTVFAIVVIFYFGPAVEEKFFPVVVDARVVVVPGDVTEPDGTRILLHSRKVRENCELVNRLVSVRITENEWVRGTAYFKDEGTGKFVELGKTRPVGDIVVDEVQIRPKGLGLHIVLLHRCHPFWLSATAETFMETLPAQPAQLPPGVQPPQSAASR